MRPCSDCSMGPYLVNGVEWVYSGYIRIPDQRSTRRAHGVKDREFQLSFRGYADKSVPGRSSLMLMRGWTQTEAALHTAQPRCLCKPLAFSRHGGARASS